MRNRVAWQREIAIASGVGDCCSDIRDVAAGKGSLCRTARHGLPLQLREQPVGHPLGHPSRRRVLCAYDADEPVDRGRRARPGLRVVAHLIVSFERIPAIYGNRRHDAAMDQRDVSRPQIERRKRLVEIANERHDVRFDDTGILRPA
jgi:hypothetical protein